MIVQDRHPQDAEILVENVLGHGPVGTSQDGLDSTRANNSSSSDLAAALGLGRLADTKSTFIHASTIGAYLVDEADVGDDDDDDDELEEEDEEDEGDEDDEDGEEDDELRDEDMDDLGQHMENVEEFEMLGSIALRPHQEGATSARKVGSDVVPGETKREKKSTGRRSAKHHFSASSTEPNPPEPFLYVDEDLESSSTTTSLAMPTTSVSVPVTSSSSEPMDLDNESFDEQQQPQQQQPEEENVDDESNTKSNIDSEKK